MLLQSRVRAASRFVSQLLAWFRANKRDMPWRRTRNPYGIWISEIMLQQTQVKTVIPYWERWMRELPTVAALAAADEQRVLKLWEGLGYYSRARNAQRAARQIAASGGAFPNTVEGILELPGVGRYTAGAIASIAFGLPAPIVDGNVARVLARYLGLRGDPKSRETSAALWITAAKLVDAALWITAAKLVDAAQEFDACGDLNQALMELGATICLPRNPECGRCPVSQKCFAFREGKQGSFPEIAARPETQTRVFRAALMERDGKIAMRLRPGGVVNSGFWELPNVEAKKEGAAKSLERLLGTKALEPKRLCDVKHTITRFRITLEVYGVEAGVLDSCKWFNSRDLDAIPLVNAHRKALEKTGYLKRVLAKQQNT